MVNVNNHVLYEFKCLEKECGEYFLAMDGAEDIVCPYCAGNIDYAPGLIEPVVVYKPGKRELITDF